MKALVGYDSFFGNTEKVAVAIAEALGAQAEVQLKKVGDVKAQDLEGLSLLVVGSPTRQFSPSPNIRAFLKTIPPKRLEGTKVAAFDTRMTQEDVDSIRILAFFVRIFGYAAQPIANRLVKRGGELVGEPEGFYVTGTEGPLVEGELERAAEWARRLRAGCKATTS